MKETKNIEIDLLQMGRVLLKNAKYIVVVAVIAGLIGWLASTMGITPIYQADAKMIVNSKMTNISTGQITSDQLASSMKLVDTCAIIIRSRTVLQPIIDQLELEDSYGELAACVSVTAVNETPVMQITVQHPDLEVAKAVSEMILKISPQIIIETVEAGSVKTVENTYASEAPVSPNVSMYTFLAAFLGGVLSSVVVIVLAMIDETFKSEGDVQTILQLPVLGVIPSIESCEVYSAGRAKGARKGER